MFKYDEVFRKMTFTVRCDDDSEVFLISEDMRKLFGFAHCGPYRTGEYTAEYGDVIRTIFTHPYYVPVARREIESNININSELGKPTPFTFGKSVVTLHFRRRHSLSPRS